ncbi:3-hydroxyisobutyryl-CoA hydrolase, mitochondrial-like isoform X2 [Leptopilina heterotoma]|uniref:3-hydroxyisobutyryl-CoA hydrolase, mitochondrial-like isoform X2 n=1 Tax=Leptopilina heterotoma TaxID=63436 RepID=UPI001CA921C4|nr:3-hydroxyisobutyryl-CoA hydrolase, mitochondrial-like isoform X2 [Leptopilina heterotoma]
MLKNIIAKLPMKYVDTRKILIRSEPFCSTVTANPGERKYDSAQSYIKKKDIGNMGIIYLNRPGKLNSMNWSMAIYMYKILEEWENCKTHVIWQSNVKNIFSAGGDVRALHFVNGLDTGTRFGIEVTKFFHRLCYFVANYQKPFITIMDGLSFGGVSGIAINSKFTVATENTMYATPETSIGSTPDVGNIYKLSKLDKNLGLYLGLTGAKLKGSDVYLAGITTHFIPSSRIHLLTKELTESNGSDISEILKQHHMKNLPNQSSMEPYAEKINHCFSAPTVEEIIDRLKNDNSDWSKNVVKTIMANSPTALKMTKQAFDISSEKNFPDCLKMEFGLTYAAMHTDFGEGIRARLIDKDNKPNWQPKTLNAVTEDYINQLFSMVPNYDQLEL